LRSSNCEAIGLRKNDEFVSGGPQAAKLFVAWVGINEDELRKVMIGKLNRLAAYRSNLSHRSIWLLLYNEGDYVTRRIHEERDIPQIKTIYREATDGNGDRFEQVWWGTDMMTGGSSLPSFHRLV